MTATTTVLPPAPTVRRRRRKAPWVIGILLFLVLLLVAAYVVAEILIRNYATDRVRTEVVQGLAVEESDVDVQFAGSMVLQALAGSIAQADVTVDDATFGPLTGDLDIQARGVPLDSSQPVDEVDLSMAVSEENVADLADYLTGLEVADIALAEPEILVESEFSLFGVGIPVQLGLEPAAVDAQLAFTPASIEVAGRRLTAEELQSSEFGGIAEPLLAQRQVCIAEYLPEALVLRDVNVVGEQLVADFQARSVVLSEEQFSTVGTCP